MFHPTPDIHWTWLTFCLLLYPTLGWLFGSYTVLRWRRLSLTVLLQRLLITASVTLMVVAVARWFVNPGEEVWLVSSQVQLVWLFILTSWSLLIRLALRRGLFFPDSPRLVLLASDDEIPQILKAWSRTSPAQSLEPTSPSSLDQYLNDGAEPLLVALSSSLRHDSSLVCLLERLEIQDPRLVKTISVTTLFEKQQERLPPILLADTFFLTMKCLGPLL